MDEAIQALINNLVGLIRTLGASLAAVAATVLVVTFSIAIGKRRG